MPPVFDDIQIITQHSMAQPVLFRVNAGDHKDAKRADIFWNHSLTNRFSIPERSQTYLATTLDGVSEATPWRKLLYNGLQANQFSDGNIQAQDDYMYCDKDELVDYFVSYIIPTTPLRLLNLVHESPALYRANPDIWTSSDLSYAYKFSQALNQVAEKYDIDGIYYRSKFQTFGHNLYVTDRARSKLGAKSVILRRNLLDVLEPLRDELARSLKVKW